jgi:hypothetical protein
MLANLVIHGFIAFTGIVALAFWTLTYVGRNRGVAGTPAVPLRKAA